MAGADVSEYGAGSWVQYEKRTERVGLKWSAWARCAVQDDNTIHFLVAHAWRKKTALASLDEQINELSWEHR
ncbi:MAG: hypothetical protein WC054_05535 [Candidatus Nanopelagicales bacterium]